MSFYPSGSTSKQAAYEGRSEFDILKASHKFLREDGEEDDAKLSWNDKLAKKYYGNLYREYAVCDLKHYKSGNFALRWRTESEVISGAGETTCGNARCPLHDQRAVDELKPSLKTLELPFSYVEDGENKFALVKVVLCDKCLKKLMWKRTKEMEAQVIAQGNGKVKTEEEDARIPQEASQNKHAEFNEKQHGRKSREKAREMSSRHPASANHRDRRRSSRSRSPLPTRSSGRSRPE